MFVGSSNEALGNVEEGPERPGMVLSDGLELGHWALWKDFLNSAQHSAGCSVQAGGTVVTRPFIHSLSFPAGIRLV